MMEGYLDISGCSKEWREAMGVDRIPVRVGVHEHDLDIMEHSMPQNLRAWMEKKYEDAGIPYRKDLPVGLNLKSIPPGAVLYLEG